MRVRRVHTKRFTGLVALAAAVGAMALPGITLTSASAAPTPVDSHVHDVISTVKEIHIDVDGGETTPLLNVACPAGYYAIDGGFLLDAVDPDGTPADIQVLTNQPNNVFSAWTLKIRNDTDMRAQGKGKVVCLSGATTNVDKHTHSIAAPKTAHPSTNPKSWGDAAPEWGEYEAAMTCDTGWVATAPIWDFASGSGYLLGTSLSGPNATMTMLANEPSKMYAGAVCVNPTLSAAIGAGQVLEFHSRADTLTVGGNGRADRIVTCENASIGVGSAFASDAGLLSMGNNPQGTSRMFRFFNDTDDSASADLTLLCLGAKTKNTTPPPTPLSVDVTTADLHASPTGKYVRVQVSCNLDCNVKVVLKARENKGTEIRTGRTLAYGKAKLEGSPAPQWVRLSVKRRYWQDFKTIDFWGTLIATAGDASDSADVTVYRTP